MDYKAPDAFRTISEVAEDLDLPQHVLRFWETRFSQIKPLKRGGGRRYYRPTDVDLLRGIRHMLYGEGYTIKGVQRILKEQGPQGIIDIGRSSAAGRLAPLPLEETPGEAPYSSEHDLFVEGAGSIELSSEEGDYGSEERTPGGFSGAPDVAPAEPALFPQRPAMAARAPDVRPQESSGPSQAPQVERLQRPVTRPAPPLRSQPVTDDGELIPAGILPDDRPHRPARFVERMLGHDTKSGLSRDDVRRLQSTLFELLECKRVLDQAR